MEKRSRRMALTLPAEVEAAIFELAEAAQKPASTVVVDLLREMVPQLRDLAKVTRAVKAGKADAAKRALAHMMGNAMAEVLQEQLPLTASKPKGRR